MLEAFITEIPLGRAQATWDIGITAVYLASDAARCVNGDTIVSNSFVCFPDLNLAIYLVGMEKGGGGSQDRLLLLGRGEGGKGGAGVGVSTRTWRSKKALHLCVRNTLGQQHKFQSAVTWRQI